MIYFICDLVLTSSTIFIGGKLSFEDGGIYTGLGRVMAEMEFDHKFI